ELKYNDKDNSANNEVFVIHRAPLSTHERFIAFLIENYAGKFPLWLSPEQVRIMTISDKSIKYAEKVKEVLKQNDIRVETDLSSETINKKVRNAQLMKIPLMLTVGEKEEANGTLAVRTLDGDVLFGVKIDDFVSQVNELISKRTLETKLRK
ncbi:MAG: His/Gly/Thr/Pro-type tRNA ligase C-terminal domain-containing protein, partial [Nanoarchaeota archaeon]